MSKKKYPKYKGNPVFFGLPENLKNPENYFKIEKALLETLSCPKGHSDPAQMFDCMKCKRNTTERRELMTRLGFRSVEQYMAWKKVMHYMAFPNRLQAKIEQNKKERIENIEKGKKLGVIKDEEDEQDADTGIESIREDEAGTE